MADAAPSASTASISEVYAEVAARRTQFDNLLWQVPVLTIIAQAFLFTISLGADTRPTARIISCLLSLLVTFLTLHLFVRHRQTEITDAHWLETLSDLSLFCTVPRLLPPLRDQRRIICDL